MAMTTTTTQTVRIQIAKDDKKKEWTIAPKDVMGTDSRFDACKKDFDNRWNKRKREGTPSAAYRDHKPIIFREGDVLQFECEFDFEIGAKKNPDVDEVPGTPDNPFGWTKEQS